MFEYRVFDENGKWIRTDYTEQQARRSMLLNHGAYYEEWESFYNEETKQPDKRMLYRRK